MTSKSSRAVLRAVVLPALGLTSAELLLPACDRSASQATVEQGTRQIAVPGMPSEPVIARDSGLVVADTGVAQDPVRDIPPPGTIAPPPREPPPDSGLVRRPPPGPPARRLPGVREPMPRPGPPSRELAGLTEKRNLTEEKPAERTERRGRTPPSSGSLPGIAGSRRASSR
ncbi:MAG: hypothetical protein JNK05_10375 [Myxococcales bacterium]|nr:hypothetical protein [Myxococcales bacterium]